MCQQTVGVHGGPKCKDAIGPEPEDSAEDPRPRVQRGPPALHVAPEVGRGCPAPRPVHVAGGSVPRFTAARRHWGPPAHPVRLRGGSRRGGTSGRTCDVPLGRLETEQGRRRSGQRYLVASCLLPGLRLVHLRRAHVHGPGCASSTRCPARLRNLRIKVILRSSNRSLAFLAPLKPWHDGMILKQRAVLFHRPPNSAHGSSKADIRALVQRADEAYRDSMVFEIVPHFVESCTDAPTKQKVCGPNC